jgi:hypothetical protein
MANPRPARAEKTRPLSMGAGLSLRRNSNPGGLLGELVACLVGVMLGVKLAGLVTVVLRVEVVGVGDMGMVGRLLVMPGRMGLRGGVVMLGGVLVVGGGMPVVIDLFLVGHVICC